MPPKMPRVKSLLTRQESSFTKNTYESKNKEKEEEKKEKRKILKSPPPLGGA